jgi:hypothetical protein
MELDDSNTPKTFRDVFANSLNSPEKLGLDYLMDLHDDAFVIAAYELLLGRRADPTGIRYYTGRLRRGFSRTSVLDQMVRSNEARGDWRSIAGLSEAIDRFRRSRTLSGWRLALNDPELGRTPARRQARIFQNEMGAQRRLIAQTADQIHSGIVAGSLRQAPVPADERRNGDDEEFSSIRFQPPRPRAISEIRELDLPDRIRAAVRLLDF